jgi:hypothetical protein
MGRCFSEKVLYPGDGGNMHVANITPYQSDEITEGNQHFHTSCVYRMFQKEPHNFENLYKFIQRYKQYFELA